MIPFERELRVGRVRLRAAAGDGLALRMRADAALRPLDPLPPAMPPQSILCIRAMDDPLPGGIDLRTAHARRAIEWEHAARIAIDAAFHRAVRPFLVAVPETADAVLFADRAELLACAARDVCRNSPASLSSSSWWWARTVAPSLSREAVVREWMRAPVYVAAALSLLSDAVDFVALLAPSEAMALLRAAVAAAGAFRTIELPDIAMAARLVPPSAPRAPWYDVVPELARAPAMTLAHHLFAGVTLALRRAPARARSETFAEETIVWTRALSVSQIPSPRPRGEGGPFGFAQGRLRPGEGRHSPKMSTEATAPVVVSEAEPTRPEDRQECLSSTEVTTTPAQPPLSLNDSTQHSAVSTPDSGLDLVISDLAGTFFLINIAISFGFYGPFVECELPLDPWDFLALAGRALEPALEDDPLWPLLALLANRRDDEPPGASFIPPDDQPFEEWLAALVLRIRERLALALPVEEAAAFLLRRSGRIAVTPAHVDVYFALETHPIEIRAAGLDRDPGWIPAAGRHVAFHFD